MEKKFSLENATNPENNYRTQILSIINALERRIRVTTIPSNTELFATVHKKKLVDARKEVVEFEPIRRDICEAFAVPSDSEHTFMFDAHRGSFDSSVKQRAIRCFSVVFDALKHEGYYGEGRTIHNLLLNKIIELITARNVDMTEEAVYEGMETDTPRFIFVKGFMSANDFRELDDKYRQEQEHPLVDDHGQKIETAKGWFISGSSLEDLKTIKGESGLTS
ncbi:MAG: hypothetical protein UY50_C0007G0003 [Parcubacteria group bacterium GW2011_GWA2_49_9]|nr:MAG: hypothetical protein UY50_C0007G0003 [Parcubacteria group bacterium GW2011_GWA2_49_9]